MADNITELGLSTQEAVSELLTLTGALDRYAGKLDKVASVSVSFGKDGKMAALAVKELDNSLNTLNTKFKATEDGWAVIAEGASNATTQIRALSQAIASIREGSVKNRISDNAAESASQNRDALSGAFTNDRASAASAGEMRAFDAAVNRLNKEISQSKTSLSELDGIFRKAAAGVEPLTSEESRLLALIRQCQVAADQFGSAAMNASNRAARAAQVHLKEAQRVYDQLIKSAETIKGKELDAARDRAVGVARGQVSDTFGAKLASATPSQVIRFNQSINQAILLLQRGKVSAEQFADALNRASQRKPLGNLDGDLARLEAHLNNAARQFDQVGKVGDHAGKSITISWQGVLRMFQSEILYRTFASIQQGLMDSISTAQEYSQKLALIQTISQDANVSYAQWAEGIRKVSDEMGSPLVETAAGAYDLLSNQVTRGAETMNTLREAIEFGRTTNATAEDSVNLLSSAINSFHLGADGAGRAARVFFTTIDLGRVTASEMANSFGRTGVLAESLGVTLEETSAAISSMTRQGIKGNEAYTLLNNVFLKFLKPTEEMKKWLKDIGFETGQDAIQALGFTQVLTMLDKEFDGNTAKMATFFDELRGARGIINMTGQGLRELKNDLRDSSNSAERYDKAKELVANSPGMKLQVEMAQLKNFVINDFGTAVMNATVKVIEAFGGAKNMVKSLKVGLEEIVVVIGTYYAQAKIAAGITFLWSKEAAIRKAAFAIYEFATGTGVAGGMMYNLRNAVMTADAAMMSLIGKAKALMISMWPMLVAGAIVELGYLIYEARRARQLLIDVNTEILGSWRETAAKLNQADREATEKSHTIWIQHLDKTKAAILGFFAELTTQYDKAGEKIRDRQAMIAQSLGTTFDTLKSVLSKAVSDIESAAKTAADNVRKAEESVEENRRDADRALFERNLKRAQQAKDYATEVEIVNRRIQDLENAKARAFNAGDISAANAAYQEQLRVLTSVSAEVQKIAVLMYRPAHTVTMYQDDGNRRREIQNVPVPAKTKVVTENHPIVERVGLERMAAELLQRQLGQLDTFRKKQIAIRDEAAKRAEAMKTEVAELEKNFAKLRDFSVLDKKGEVKDEYQGEAGRAKAMADATALQKAVSDGLSKTGAGIPQQAALLAGFQQQLAALMELMKGQKGALKDQLENLAAMEAVSKAADATKKSYEESTKAAERLKKEVTDAKAATRDLKTEAEALAKVLKLGVSNDSSIREEVRSEFDDIIKGLEGAVKSGSSREVESYLNDLKRKYKQYWQEGSLQDVLTNATSTEGPLKMIDIMERLKTKTVELESATQKLNNAEGAYGKLVNQISILETLMARMPEKFKGMESAAASAAEAITTNISAADAAFNAFNQNLADAIIKLREIEKLKASGAGMGGSGSVEKKARGGMVGYFSDGAFLSDFLAGKFASGTDRVPAMLTRGEYVVNSEQTRQFLPLLRAINAGKLTPSSGGGGFSMGDLNVTVQGGSTADGTIKNIAAGLKRGLRTGAIRPF